jgi:hypothetical protein
MGFTFKQQKFSAKLDEFEDAVAWLSAVGIDYFQSRIAQYRASLRDLVNNLDQVAKDDARFPEIVNALYESTELIKIYRGLSKIANTDELKLKLKLFVKGPTYATFEKPVGKSHQPRDIGFELFIASLCSLAGYNVQLDATTDILVQSEDTLFLIECKRPRGSNSVRACIRGAASQLKERYRNPDGISRVFGVIAVSIDLVLNPEHLMLVTTDDKSIHAILSSTTKKFADENSKHWKTIDHPKTAGIMFSLQTVAIPQKQNIISSCNYLASANIAHSQTAPGEQFLKFANALTPAVLDLHGGTLTSRSPQETRDAKNAQADG